MAYGVESLPASLKPENYAGYLIQWIKAFRANRLSYTGRKTIVFCRTKAIVDQLYQALEPQAARFHSDLSEEDKLAQLAYFRAEGPILLATSGIGAGYDFPDVDLVIHFKPGRNLAELGDHRIYLHGLIV
ncbi:P-loop containing nucleoside triphosphate hydrolase protein [Penicillium angulare]|uniref:P-loop containing nucleoside triphosphate hydrolase protein n=1 Tax=Penicillium angulare TaxID=116970 RepID=UPI00253FCC92|nr:P-loop containing nucleoside triphosphate hydrolase protein [Penicillium angulare]KAJ5282018.1 P-loop containing nucleoside triphosphate hydrolase protein [Penicillium angulare]